MKYGKLKYGTFMSRNSGVSSPTVWSNMREVASVHQEKGRGALPTSVFESRANRCKWRLVLGWDYLFTPDAYRRIAGGQQRYLPMIVNKPWFEETDGQTQKMSTGPLAVLVVSSPGCECTLKKRWCYDQVVCHLSLAPRQGVWGIHKNPLTCMEKMRHLENSKQ